MKRTTKHVFAVVRLDRFLTGVSPLTKAITVKEVVPTQEEAESDVRRLNALSRGKDRLYCWQVTRLEGQSQTIYSCLVSRMYG